METEQRQLNAFDLPPEICDVILAVRCPSTKIVYASHWDKLVAWCSSCHVDPLCTSLLEGLWFVLPFTRQGLVLGTVKLSFCYLCFLQFLNQPWLFQLPVVTHFLDGLQHL